ncbi:MAG TPA: PIG-L family deacetylase [Acidimicrobiales bacterium]|nr:PIG-L family deacetylase [Acidimicrobiales bacterium]
MSTLVAFHAHPDDECMAQSGTLAKAAADGHRTVVVYATRGEVGEVADGFLDPGETLVERRMVEAQRSAAVLGVARVEWLGYRDSGMMGTPENDDPRCFWRADGEEAAARLAAIVREEAADVLTVYDVNGHYGHPDHIQVHRVGVRAAELAGTPQVLELTWDRDHLRTMMKAAAEAGASIDDLPDFEAAGIVFGTPGDQITTRVDVRPYLARKRASMEAHASQIQDTGPLLALPEDAFSSALGTEWYIRRSAPPGTTDTDIFTGL